MSTIDPSHTLYITNIPGKINVEELKANLYDLFSTYGPVLDITAKDTYKMREQAFVVYTNIASATTAKRALNGFNFFSKPLKIDYAKTKSDAIAKLDGTYRLRTHSVMREGEEDENETRKVAKVDHSDEDSDDHA